MTAITAGELSAPDFEASATAFDRTLLRAASALDAYVVLRVHRRGSQPRDALIAQTAAGDERRHAEAAAAIGMLPR